MDFQSHRAWRARLRSRPVLAALTLALLLGASLGVSATLVKRAHAAALSVCLSGACAYHSVNDALAAASAGDTITVAAGTYTPAAETGAGASHDDHAIIINKAVAITGAGAGSTVLNVASAYVNTSSGSGVVRILNPGGNVTLSGFTIEGSNVNDPNGDGIMVAINDTNANDLITVRQNTFHEDSTLDPGLIYDQVDAIYDYDGTATVDVLGNTFEGIFRALLAEGNLGPLHFQGNLLNNLHGQWNVGNTTSQTDYGAEGVLFLADNFVNSSAIQDVSGNTFQNYAGMAVGADAGYGGGLVGAVNNLAITNNTLDVEGENTGAQGETSVLYFRGFGASGNGVNSLINGVSIDHNTFAMTSNGTTGHGHAIRFRGAIGVNNTVNHNSLVGGGTTVPLDGIELDTTTNNDDVRISDNVIKGFQNGLHADALPGGAGVVAHDNCIAGNTLFGATNDLSGASINAQGNWWGAATGPNTAGADSASGNIDTSSFLTTAAAICAANASTLVTVTGADVTAFSPKWFYADTRNAGTGAFVLGAATPPYGVGSFKLTTAGSADKAQLMTSLYSGTKLADIDGISYHTYRDPAATGFSAGVAGLNLRVFFDPTNTASYRYMVYEPYQDQGNSAVLTGDWQQWDAYRGGQARWWITGTFGNSSGCGQATPCTWAHILSLYPNAAILDDPITGAGHFQGSFGVNQGSGNNGFITNVDGLSLSVNGQETIFNFDPAAPSASLSIATPAYVSGSTTYITSASQLAVTGFDFGGTIASVSYRLCPTSCASAPPYTTTVANLVIFFATGADGPYEVDYYATDTLGQQSAPLSRMLALDNTAPAASIAIGQPQSAAGGVTLVDPSTPFTVTATDGGSGVASVSYRFFPKGGTAPAFTVTGGATATFKLSGAFGDYEVDYDATDHLGNDPIRTIFVTLTSITPGEDVAGNPPSGGPPSGAQPPAGAAPHAPVGVSQANGGPNAPVRLPKPSHARQSATSGQPGWLLALWLLLGAVAAAGAGGAGYFVLRQRRAARG